MPALVWNITQLRVAIACQRFGATCWSHLQGSRRPLQLSLRKPPEELRSNHITAEACNCIIMLILYVFKLYLMTMFV